MLKAAYAVEGIAVVPERKRETNPLVEPKWRIRAKATDFFPTSKVEVFNAR